MSTKLNISQDILDRNFLFYLFLKEINGTNGLTTKEINSLLEHYYTFSVPCENLLEIFINEIDKIKKDEKRELFKELLLKIVNDEIFILFIFALKLISIKPLLLVEAKIVSGASVASKKKIHPLSLEYDTLSKANPYYTRVNGALFSLLFFHKLEHNKFNFMTTETENLLKSMCKDYHKVKQFGIEANQIFMLMFSESINQSIISSAGGNYEDRILNILLSLGLKKDEIKKTHDTVDSSTEYDFFFNINGKSYGIGAKRTLRERYKQFIKTSLASNIDVVIEITLGLDLTEEKAKAIRSHNTYLFVADEIYNSRLFLQNIIGIYKVSELTLDLLKKL